MRWYEQEHMNKGYEDAMMQASAQERCEDINKSKYQTWSLLLGYLHVGYYNLLHTSLYNLCMYMFVYWCLSNYILVHIIPNITPF